MLYFTALTYLTYLSTILKDIKIHIQRFFFNLIILKIWYQKFDINLYGQWNNQMIRHKSKRKIVFKNLLKVLLICFFIKCKLRRNKKENK